jgi:hypothetical protein
MSVSRSSKLFIQCFQEKHISHKLALTNGIHENNVTFCGSIWKQKTIKTFPTSFHPQNPSLKIGQTIKKLAKF